MLRATMTTGSEGFQAVVELFQGPLAGVRFANVDAKGLSALAAEVATATEQVAEQEAKLGELRQGLAQRQEALGTLTQQALAYARIYAEGDEQLLAKLNAIALPRSGKARKPAKLADTEAAASGDGTALEVAALSAEPAASDTAPSEASGASDEDGDSPRVYARPKVKRRLGRASSQGDAV